MDRFLRGAFHEQKSIPHEEERQCSKIIGIEDMFITKAKALNKKIGGLEDHSRQLMFEDVPVQALINGMKKAVAAEKTRNAIVYQYLLALQKFANIEERLFGASPLEEQYFNNELTYVPEINDEPMLHRNQCMFLKMQENMLDKTCLFMIGFAHLHGPIGLLQMLYDNGYRVTPLSNKNIHEEVETLKRQTFSTVVAFLTLYMGVTSVMSGDTTESILAFILSGLICYGIYERTHFLRINSILASLSMCQAEMSKEMYSASDDLYQFDEENESEHISQLTLG